MLERAKPLLWMLLAYPVFWWKSSRLYLPLKISSYFSSRIFLQRVFWTSSISPKDCKRRNRSLTGRARGDKTRRSLERSAFIAIYLLVGSTDLFAELPHPSSSCRSLFPASMTRGGPYSPPLIVIDAGHGGRDHGTRSHSTPIVLEKDLALVTAKQVKRQLELLGCQVMLTRDEDLFVALDERARRANNARATCFVSIHYNAALNLEARGVEIFYYRDERRKAAEKPTARTSLREERSKQLAEAILKKIGTVVPLTSRGVKARNLAVLRETTMPAVLVEGGFMTNRAESQLIQKEAFQQRLGWAIARGIAESLNFKKMTLAPFAPPQINPSNKSVVGKHRASKPHL